MGCGGSKLESEQEAGLRPILRRRIDEFLARRNAGLSKKQLLAGDVTASHRSEVEEEEEEKEEIVTKEDKTSISPPNASDDDHASFLKQDSPPSPQKISNIDDNSASILLSPILEDINDVINIKNDVNNVKNDVIINDVDEIKFENNLHDNEVIKEEECTFDQDEHERSELLSPSSPSFRVYCVHSLDEEELDDVVGQLEPVEECSQEDDKNWLRQESSNSNEQVVEEKHIILKKHKRVKMFKIGIPKGGKHIFHNMHYSLYHLPCTSHNSHFIQQAAA